MTLWRPMVSMGSVKLSEMRKPPCRGITSASSTCDATAADAYALYQVRRDKAATTSEKSWGENLNVDPHLRLIAVVAMAVEDYRDHANAEYTVWKRGFQNESAVFHTQPVHLGEEHQMYDHGEETSEARTAQTFH